MRAESVGFIGGGRIARIMLEGWSRADAMPARVVVSDTNVDALAAKLQADAATSFVESWNDLMAIIDRQSAALTA